MLLNIFLQLYTRAGNSAAAPCCICSPCPGRANRGNAGHICLGVEAQVSLAEMVLDKCFHETQTISAVAFQDLPLIVCKNLFPFAFLCAPSCQAIWNWVFKTVSGMSPLCYICHLFILALTKTIEKDNFTARAEVVKCARPLSVPDSEHWQSNNQRHVIVKYFRIIVFFLLVYCGRKSSGATCTKQAVLLPCNYYLTNWRTVINKSRACFLCVYNHMLHTYIDRSLQNIYLCA